jgi:hypothetical protein
MHSHYRTLASKRTPGRLLTGLLKHSAFSINIKIITSLVQLDFPTLTAKYGES